MFLLNLQFLMAVVANTLPIPAGVFVPVFTIGEFLETAFCTFKLLDGEC